VPSAIATSSGGGYTQDSCSGIIGFGSEITWAAPDLTIAATHWTFEVNGLSIPCARWR
jgi:hypothetical protein